MLRIHFGKSLLSKFGRLVLNEPKATGFVVLVDRNSRAQDLSKHFESVVEIPVSPAVRQPFDKKVAESLVVTLGTSLK